jgi:rRNA-processing protein CGR1
MVRPADLPRGSHSAILTPEGKQWHATKKAFRPTSGLSSFEKRAKDRVAMSAMKAKEKELKDEKEAARQVRPIPTCPRQTPTIPLTLYAATHPVDQGQARKEGGGGTLREDGREDAPQARREAEAQGEEEQGAQLVSGYGAGAE